MKIAIIGAGPRGLSLSERLIAHSKQNKQAIDLLLFDPFLIGQFGARTNRQICY